MLDKDTKTTIQNARDVLVGKVPNPVSQIDLITTAMIYKFMDDMDLENIEFGGKRVFFTGDLEPYAWSKLMNPKLGHYMRISLYAKALDELQVAKQIPELFRKIFKNAFLPFRDGATLSLFLNEINQLKYDNSENLGDAFEFLLSVMGSQGDAGQFRTPRHIIDFIVEVVNPLKTDTVLDPACGTAGFLISAYKHILNQAKQEGKLLSPEEMKNLTDHINGYDISPDMVKLASVNLFLHQFKQPHIYEYDTLSSEDRWDDKFDVILANPPFMTPKGGIMPHNRFGVKSNRSEVLFVDYFMEHLSSNGKAGFVVPEGIIFQSANAYKSLRKMMVEENYLYAVVSLPSGVFNPYSGVKTSILFFDKKLAQKTDKILFVKIENDGFDLGAQRRPIKENDIPKALEALKAYQNSIEQNTEFDTAKYGKCLLVSKDKIRENGEYNLTASRYEETKDYTNCQYEMVKLGDVCNLQRGTSITKNQVIEGTIPVIAGGQKPAYYHNEYNRTGEMITVSGSGAYAGFLNYFNEPIFVSDAFTIEPNSKNSISSKYLYYILKNKQDDIYKLRAGAGIPHIYPKDFSNIKIPLPALEVQEEIVKELEQYQAIIDGAQKVVDNWRPTFPINPNWEKVKLGDVCDVRDGTHDSPPPQMRGYPLITSKNLIDGKINFNNVSLISEEDYIKICKRSNVDDGDILFAMIGTIGNPVIVEKDRNFAIKNVALFKIGEKNTKLYNKYLKMLLEKNTNDLKHQSIGGNQKFIGLGFLREYIVSLPPLDEQKAIVAKIEQEEQYVDACKKLIAINQQKISDKIKSIWNNED